MRKNERKEELKVRSSDEGVMRNGPHTRGSLVFLGQMLVALVGPMREFSAWPSYEVY